MKVPYLSFTRMNDQVREGLQEAFMSVLDSHRYILGAQVERFEGRYAAFSGTAHCVGTSNGLDALCLCLKALGVSEGDEVVVPSNTYIATVLAVTRVGASPVFAEPDERTYNLDPEQLEGALTTNTKAVIPVHLYGQACAMDRIMQVAGRRGIPVVEDNAQAQGATFNARPTGSWGRINATSFYPTKNLGALGDAGAVTTDDAALAALAATLRNYGADTKYHNRYTGYNMRLDELQAAFLSVKLERLEAWNRERQSIAARYGEGLKGVGDLCLPETQAGASHVYHIYQVRTTFRDALVEYLAQKGIGTAVHYPVPPHLQEAYASLGFRKGDFPIAETLADTCLSLPIWPGMTEADTAAVIDSVRSFFTFNHTSK